jgi:hypothetical protein
MKTYTNKELLLLAAKAHGLKIVDSSSPEGLFRYSKGCHGGVYWNPFDEPADAMYLAVQLKLSMIIYPACVQVEFPKTRVPLMLIGAEPIRLSIDCKDKEYIEHEHEYYARLMRRAIVIAAAMIGEQK